MVALLAFLFIAVPILELAVIVQVAGSIGVGWTLVALFGISVIGAWLVRHQGLSVLQRVRRQLARGEMPTTELVDGLLILVGGTLMLTPGFITDAVGLVLLLPPGRALIRPWLSRGFKSRIEVHRAGPGGGFMAGGFADGDFIDLVDVDMDTDTDADTDGTDGPDDMLGPGRRS